MTLIPSSCVESQEALAAKLRQGVTTTTVYEAAVLKNCSATHAYQQIADGKWPVVRNGRSIRVQAEWLRRELGITVAEKAS